ncbi:MAG: CBS domain-containing protein [Xanthomonadales bacterium]|jgi:CBS domain-containing protein|nr:CBS domain-containing protein [Xanthomonadales bacterium]
MEKLPKVYECMDQVVPTLSPDTPILKAVSFLLRHRVTGAPVVDYKGKLLGIITESDLLRLISEGVGSKPPKEAKVADFMTSEVVTVPSTTDVYFVAGVFNRNRFRRLPVVDDGRVVGAITRYDLLRVIQEHAPKYW